MKGFSTRIQSGRRRLANYLLLPESDGVASVRQLDVLKTSRVHERLTGVEEWLENIQAGPTAIGRMHFLEVCLLPFEDRLEPRSFLN